jgi:hypothetical protein
LDLQPTGVRRIGRAVADVSPDIGIPGFKPNRVLADEPADRGIVVPGPVEVEAGLFVRFTAGEAEEMIDGGVGFTSDLAECVVGG